MRDFKKYFFTSLLQLTILANVFRQNSRFSNLIINDSQHNTNYLLASGQLNRTQLDGQLDLILLRDNFNRFNQTSQSSSNLDTHYRTKETLAYLKDLRLINLLNRHNLSTLNQFYYQNQILLLPASFLNSTNTNHKNISDLTETRLLLNSIELNFNNPTLKKEFEMDIELQTLLEQDIDLGINKNFYYGQQNLDSNQTKFDDIIKTNKFESNFELEFKNEDIITATKYIQEGDLGDDLNLFVEEDTGELVLIPNTARPSAKLHTNATTLHFQSNNSVNKTGLSFGNRSIFDPLPDQIVKPPCVVHDSSQAPLFLSQVSVCKTLESLNQENDLNSNNNNASLPDSFLPFNDTLLNDFFNTNNVTSTQNYTVYYDQPTTNESKINNSTSIVSNQTNLLGDQFMFEDQFLKDFEANLDKYGLNELTNTSEVTSTISQNTIRNNQTIGGFSNVDKSPSYKLQATPLQNDTEPLIEQININELFKMFENETQLNDSNSNSSYLNDVASTISSSLAPQSFIMNANKLNTTNDDEAKFLNIFKQETIEINDTSNQNLISTINLPHLAQSEELTAAIRGFQHNHTYLDGAGASNDSDVYHPYSYKNKLKKMLKSMDNEETSHVKHQESRDQLLLQENRINATLNQVVESTADEFNELVKELQLTSEQLTIIKDIRRRGKNKVAAQICRKRKIDSIESLKEDVEHLSELKLSLDNEHDLIQEEIRELTKQFDELYKELMGDKHEMNDAMMAYMNNLKGQVNRTTIQASSSKPIQSSLLRSINSENSDDTNSDDYDDSSNHSSQLNDDIIEATSPFETIKKFKKF